MAAAGPTPAGAHALADHLAARLVRRSGVAAGDLVFDLGAGAGALTVPLARTGAHVVAVERDERVARRLAARVAEFDNVTVVTGDALAVPLPRRPYLVVANIPFGITAALLRRLLDSPLTAADLVVERGAGRRLTAARPGRVEVLRWQAAFDLTLGPVLKPHSFRPPPTVDGVVLRIRRRPRPPAGLPSLLQSAYRSRSVAVGRVVGRATVRRAGVDPHLPVAALTADDWLAIAGSQHHLNCSTPGRSRPQKRPKC